MRNQEELPEGWTLARVSDLAAVSSGKFLKRTEYRPERSSENPFPVAGAGGPIGWARAANADAPVITLGRVGACGVLNRYLEPAWVTDNALLVRPFERECGDWLCRFFETVRWAELHTGSSQPLITQTLVRELEVPVPPLAEQKRIVEKVEALLAQVQAARDRLERVQQILKRFRQAVLAAACLGDLTAEWRERHADVPSGLEYLKSILGRRNLMATGPSGRVVGSTPILEPTAEDLPGLPASWTWTTIDALSTKVVDGVHRTPEYQGHGVPFVTVRNLTAGPELDLKSLKYIRPSDHREFIKRANPERGDLLISKDGTLGVVRAIRTDDVFSIFVSVALVKPVERGMTDFLEIVLSSPPVQQRLVPTGSGLQHLHLRDLKSSPVPLPPAAEQIEIVRRVRLLLSLAEAIERRVSPALARASCTPQAILAKAFAGELVPAEAELARAEGRGYESGVDLLRRVYEGACWK